MLDKSKRQVLEQYTENLRYKYIIAKGKIPDFSNYEGLCDFIFYFGGEIICADFKNNLNKDICILNIIDKNKFEIIIDENYIKKANNPNINIKINLIALKLLCIFLEISKKDKNVTDKKIYFNNKFGKIKMRKK